MACSPLSGSCCNAQRGLVAHFGTAPSSILVLRRIKNHARAALRRKELIFRRESSSFANTVEYAFKHDLLRNVAYESLLRKSRRAYHGQLAAWFIDQSRERINEVAALVAGHFEQASDTANAAEWFGRAGQQARAGYAPATAIDYFRKALALL